MTIYWLVVVIPVVLLGISLLNLLVWPRGRPDHFFPGTVSILIPARDEESRIETTVRAALKNTHRILEVLVYDDGSQDGTPDILHRISQEDERLRIIRGEGLPPGWIGKPHACHRLAEEASGDFLCFVDADTVLEPRGLEHAAAVFDRLKADVVTAVPRQVTLSWFERLVLPLLHLTYVSWLPLPLVWLSGDPRFMAANGQLLVIRTADYFRFGGYERVRLEVVDDMAFCRTAKEQGLRVVFADGYHMASCRMYTSAREVWEGFSKNLYEGIGAQPSALLTALLLNTIAFLLPWFMLAFSCFEPKLLVPSLIGVSANVLERALLAWRFHHSKMFILLHPLSIAALLAIAVNSWRWQRAGAITWRGRVYGSRTERRNA